MSTKLTADILERHVVGCVQCKNYSDFSQEQKDVVIQLYRKKCYEKTIDDLGAQNLNSEWLEVRKEMLSVLPPISDDQRVKCEKIATHAFSNG
jgi:L-rhamnose mutarotase